MIVIPGETLSAHSARPRKIPESIVLVRENISVNKRAYRKEAIEIVLRGFSLLSFSNFTFGFHGFHLKKVESNSIRFWNWSAQENLDLYLHCGLKQFQGKRTWQS